jgi:hypothetical protein
VSLHRLIEIADAPFCCGYPYRDARNMNDTGTLAVVMTPRA